MVGFSFKETRFKKMHREAIRFPLERFTYVGVDPEGVSGQQLQKGELEKSVGPYTRDPYGCGDELAAKREERNPFHRSHGYFLGCPELRDLLNYCGPDRFPGDLPWLHL